MCSNGFLYLDVLGSAMHIKTCITLIARSKPTGNHRKTLKLLGFSRYSGPSPEDRYLCKILQGWCKDLGNTEQREPWPEDWSFGKVSGLA